jgi:hypothetical protein
MKARDYIQTIVKQLEQGDALDCGARRAAFISAALAIMEVVESPRKEEALVSLASLSLAPAGQQVAGNTKKAA